MVSYRRRGNVWQYEISYKDRDGTFRKLRKSGFTLKTEAELAASQVRSTYIDMRQYKAGNMLLADYFDRWLRLYKEHSVTNVTLVKYHNTLQHLRHLFGTLRLKDLTRSLYQEKINQFAETHAPRTVATFHKQIRASLLDALDEKIISFDPTRKTVITGIKVHHPQKALDYNDWRKLIKNLNTNNTEELIIYLAAVSGMRYAEILGMTRSDINVNKSTISINKTWDYKYHTGFKKTKNKSSVRLISLDHHTVQVLQKYLSEKPSITDEPLFLTNGRAPVSAEINKVLTSHLQKLNLPRITFHGLRHTHASILLYQGVSVLSVSKRLGHSNITTTQSTYLHVIKELEALDNDKIIAILDGI
ncbi:MAG: site-specific integrase [Oenococcus sp.]|uniref:tyrosine-type recombinase/integrase n=1 Tax=Oenococcus sp. TaxID=1979414 RepID=UPI0039E7A031